jgi:uncharacterized protein YndB with AHSA1/START domain
LVVGIDTFAHKTTDTMSYDWSKFTKKINVRAPIEAVYLAWTKPELLERWLLRKVVFLSSKKNVRDSSSSVQEGDTYEWYWHGHEDDVVEKGEILLANGFSKLQFSFTAGALVTIEIGKVLDETILMLTQEKIPTDDEAKVKYHVACQCGWTFYLTNLKSYLEGGVDLRNKNVALANVVNA